MNFCPKNWIAQTPAEPRDHSRLMVVHRATGEREDKHFYDIIDYLNPNDALVINETKVIPARLLGEKKGRRKAGCRWRCCCCAGKIRRTGRRLSAPDAAWKPGTTCVFGGGLLKCEILESVPEIGGRIVRSIMKGFSRELLDQLGEDAAAPHIHNRRIRAAIQTVYAKNEGSAAAPTAGLHFTPELLERIRAKGVTIVPVTLHVGLGTFRPVQVEDVDKHVMHSEWYQVTEEAANTLNAIRAGGGRLICVGTTSVRTIETVATEDGIVHPGAGDTAIFIYPGKKIKAVDAP